MANNILIKLDDSDAVYVQRTTLATASEPQLTIQEKVIIQLYKELEEERRIRRNDVI
jgi:hypothetical protein